jgi:hypothetical protein
MDFVPLTPFFYTLSLFLQMAKVELRAEPPFPPTFVSQSADTLRCVKIEKIEDTTH